MCEFCGCGFVRTTDGPAKPDTVVPTLAAIPVVVVYPNPERRQARVGGRVANHPSSPGQVVVDDFLLSRTT